MNSTIRIQPIFLNGEIKDAKTLLGELFKFVIKSFFLICSELSSRHGDFTKEDLSSDR